jgi:hypothetical protein
MDDGRCSVIRYAINGSDTNFTVPRRYKRRNGPLGLPKTEASLPLAGFIAAGRAKSGGRRGAGMRGGDPCPSPQHRSP